MQIILIGNYLPDRQESMIRFAKLLHKEFGREGITSTIWWPTVFFGSRAKLTTSGLGKWLGYVDKYLVFPVILKWRLLQFATKRQEIYFHVCDHSNAPYLKYLPPDKTIITCHDVIAIRAGFGFTDSYQELSRLGKMQQKWIMSYLGKAKRIAAVSSFTLTQLKDLLGNIEDRQNDWRVIHNSLNDDFKQIAPDIANQIVSKAGLDPQIPFLLHVGSGLPRKNRKLLIDMVHALPSWRGNICYAGEVVDEDLLDYAAQLGLGGRVQSIPKPDHITLLALYSACTAFIFPSFSEGFGWPLIEAQACKAPVIASNVPPMPEVSGGAAIHADPKDPEAFARAFLCLQDDNLRNKLVELGLRNLANFAPQKMINSYFKLIRSDSK